MRRFLILLFLLSTYTMMQAQQVIPLYADQIPNSKNVTDQESSKQDPEWNILIISKVSRPTLTIFLPPPGKATGSGIVIVPGGGYGIVAAGHEGYDVAKKFAETGIAAFVLKYRLPDDSIMINKEIGPLEDAERAMQIVRERATEWKIKKDQIGIMGFSAGGHLASTEGTHYDKVIIDNPNKTSLRPDFMVLVYPVISFTDSIGHIGSRDNLLGQSPSKEKIEEYSNELHIDHHTPPSFLIHAKDDDVVKVQNSLDFYAALQKNKVPAKIYLYDKGGHGFGLNNTTSTVKWIDLVIPWIKNMDWKHQ